MTCCFFDAMRTCKYTDQYWQKSRLLDIKNTVVCLRCLTLRIRAMEDAWPETEGRMICARCDDE